MSGSARWLVLLALSGATALIYVVSLRANFLYGHSLGQTPEKAQLFAWANVAADIWKGFGLVAVLVLWLKHKRMALVALLAWLVCLATGINSAIGVYVEDRASLTGTREARRITYSDAQNAVAKVEQQLAALPVHRSVAQVEAAIAGRLAQPVMMNDRVRGTVGSVSTNCARHDARTAESCADVAALREELAAANDAAVLQREATRLRDYLRDMRDRGGSLTPDPVGEFWAWATRGLLSVRDVGFGFPLFFALHIEVVSAFGPAVVAAVAAASSLPQASDAGSSRVQQAASFPQRSPVIHWLTERTEPTDNPMGVSVHELYADYVRWCASTDSQTDVIELFSADLDRLRKLPELANKIGKVKDRYFGIALQRR
jgi:hypothetical protein